MVKMKDLLDDAVNQFTNLGYENIDVDEISVNTEIEYDGCCELCYSSYMVYMAEYCGERVRLYV